MPLRLEDLLVKTVKDNLQLRLASKLAKLKMRVQLRLGGVLALQIKE